MCAVCDLGNALHAFAEEKQKYFDCVENERRKQWGARARGKLNHAKYAVRQLFIPDVGSEADESASLSSSFTLFVIGYQECVGARR